MQGYPLTAQTDEVKADYKDVGEAAFVVLVVVFTFVFVAIWAKWNKKKRDRNGK